MSQEPATEHAAALERHTIDIIPLTERHGKPGDLFTIWFSSNIMPLTFVTGALASAVFGLSFWWSLNVHHPVHGPGGQGDERNRPVVARRPGHHRAVVLPARRPLRRAPAS